MKTPIGSAHPRRYGATRVVGALCLAAVLLLARAPSASAQVRGLPTAGATAILDKVLRLQNVASVLMIGAHPDDEDSWFIARLARGDHARVGYLSLTRGEGGQNNVGAELFEALGVIRTEELLQARALDGGEQLFGREFDFGFSKTAEEASRMWGDREVLADLVRAIRMFRPLVVYSVFRGTPADGHGHHQLSGKLARVAFHAAADPTQYPDQLQEGLRPWQARKLYVGTGFGIFGTGVGATTKVQLGQVDPLLGRTYAEVAMEGRSQHRSQRAGMPELRGQFSTSLALVEPAPAAGVVESSVFDGVDTALTAVPGIAGLPPGALGAELGGIQQAISGVVSSFDPLAPERSIPALASVVSRIRNARDALGQLAGVPAAARAEAGLLLEDKENDAVLALQAAAGVVVEALAQSETVTASDVLTATVRTYVGQPDLVRIGTVSLATPRGWAVEPIPTPAPRVGPFTIPEPADRADSFRLTVPADAPPTQPYWLRQPRQGNVYSWASGSLKAEPFDPPLVTAVAQVEIGGVAVTLRRPMQFRAVDPVRGELLRDVAVVPAVSLGFDSQLEMVPLGDRGKGRRVTVTVQNNSQKPQEGILRLDLPQGWTATPAQSTFSVSRSGDRTSITQTITPPAGAAEGRYQVRAVAMIDGRSYDQVMQTIAYPHIQTHRIYSPAVLLVSVLDVKVAPARVGYVMGSGDQVPEALRRLGLEVTLLDENALTSGDLGRFDTIVVGVNATTARPDFVASLTRLYAWASNGGTLVVQYQPPDFAQRNLTPFPAQMESLGMTGISRVTDETAPVRILVADHPRFVTPNRIRDQDFSGWVQERNLNAFTSFDPRYTALLECHDPGEGPQNGGELYASMGKGRFVYTAYAWFRELPAGVPGAYRLFANLVSLGAQGR